MSNRLLGYCKQVIQVCRGKLQSKQNKPSQPQPNSDKTTQALDKPSDSEPQTYSDNPTQALNQLSDTRPRTRSTSDTKILNIPSDGQPQLNDGTQVGDGPSGSDPDACPDTGPRSLSHDKACTMVKDLLGQPLTEEVGFTLLTRAGHVIIQPVDTAGEADKATNQSANMEDTSREDSMDSFKDGLETETALSNSAFRLVDDESDAKWMCRYRNSDSSSGENDSVDNDWLSDTPTDGCTEKAGVWGVLGCLDDCQVANPGRKECRPRFTPHRLSCDSDLETGDKFEKSISDYSGIDKMFDVEHQITPNLDQGFEEIPLCHPKYKRKNKGKNRDNFYPESTETNQDKLNVDSDEENVPESEQNPSPRKKFKWTEGTKKKMSDCGLYECFPSTDPNLEAFVRYSRSIAYPERSVDYDVSRVSRCFYYVQQRGLSPGERPETLSVDAINNTQPFSLYFQQLTSTLLPASVMAHAQSLKRFMRYVDYERNQNGCRQYAVAHMTNYLTLLLHGLERQRRRHHKVQVYSKEALDAVQPDIDYFRRKYRELLPEMKALVNRYKEVNVGVKDEVSFIKPTPREFSDVTNYLMAVITVDHAQRPGVCENMTVSEVLNARTSTNGKFRTILILDHKTGSTKPATVSYGRSEYRFIKKYHRYFRGPYMEGDHDPTTSRFFRNHIGKPFINAAANAVLRFHRSHSLPHVSSTQSRKAQETRNRRRLSREDRELCNRYLSHSPRTSQDFYEQPDIDDAVRGRQLQLGASPGGAETGTRRTQPEPATRQTQPPSVSEPGMRQTLPEPTQQGEEELLTISQILEELSPPRERGTPAESNISGNSPRPAYRETITTGRRSLLNSTNPMHGLFENTTNLEQNSAVIPDDVLLERVKHQNWLGIKVKTSQDQRPCGVVATRSFSEGEVVCDYNGVVLNARQTQQYHRGSRRDTPADKSLQFPYRGETWMIDANHPPEELGLGASYGRLVSRCRQHQNVRPVVREVGGRPLLLLVCTGEVPPGGEIHLAAGHTNTHSLRSKSCTCNHTVRHQGAAAAVATAAAAAGLGLGTASPPAAAAAAAGKPPRRVSSRVVSLWDARTFGVSSTAISPGNINPVLPEKSRISGSVSNHGIARVGKPGTGSVSQRARPTFEVSSTAISDINPVPVEKPRTRISDSVANHGTAVPGKLTTGSVSLKDAVISGNQGEVLPQKQRVRMSAPAVNQGPVLPDKARSRKSDRSLSQQAGGTFGASTVAISAGNLSEMLSQKPTMTISDSDVSLQDRRTFGVSCTAITNMAREMLKKHVSDAPPSRDWLLTLVQGHPEVVQESLVTALLYHYSCTQASRLIGARSRFHGVPAFRIIHHVEENNRPPTEAEIVSMLSDMNVGNAGVARHVAKETRTKMAATYVSVLKDLYPEGEESPSETTNLRKRSPKETLSESTFSFQDEPDELLSKRTRILSKKTSTLSKKTSISSKTQGNSTICGVETNVSPTQTSKQRGDKPGKDPGTGNRKRALATRDTVTGRQVCDASTPLSFNFNKANTAKRKLDFDKGLSTKKSKLRT